MCSVSCRENMRGTNLSLCKQQEAQGSWLTSRGTSEYESACTCERVHTYTCMKHYTLLFFSLLHESGMERLNLLCCNRSWVLYVFVFTSLVMAKIKRNENKIKTEKHTKIHNIVLHLADGQYIFSVLLFVCNVCVTPLSILLVCGSWVVGAGLRSSPLLSATFNTIKLSAITKVIIPQSLGHSHFKFTV